MDVHILKMCNFYFVHIFRLFLRGVELRHFSNQKSAKMVSGLFNL